jgi:hypothetical protein
MFHAARFMAAAVALVPTIGQHPVQPTPTEALTIDHVTEGPPPLFRPPTGAEASHGGTSAPAAGSAGPHLLEGPIAGVIVRVRADGVCTGTPIAGTTLVITAAHCVLDDDGAVANDAIVTRGGVTFTAKSVLVDRAYHDAPGPALDVAVLIFDEEVPGPSAQLGDAIPTGGSVVLAGLQPLDTDGSLLRGTRHDDRPRPRGSTGGVVEIESAPAGCVRGADDVDAAVEVHVPCGLIPGASGGGLFIERGGDVILVGVVSTVSANLQFNGVAPVTAVHELLADPEAHAYEFANELPTSARVLRS